MYIYIKKQLCLVDGVSQVAKCPPSKCEALNSNPSIAKKKKKQSHYLAFFYSSYFSEVISVADFQHFILLIYSFYYWK
jgi:hypothetical protein